MKNAILSLFLMLAFSPAIVIAQSGFEQLYSKSGSLKILELNNHDLLIGVCGGSSASGITLADSQGNIIETNSYWDEPILGVASYHKAHNNNEIYFVTGGYGGGSCPHTPINPVVGKMDSVGNVLSLKYYILNDGCQSLAIGLETTSDNGVVTWGWQTNFFALRVDSDLNLVWSKHFNHHGGFKFIKELPGGDLLAGINMDTAGVVVARMDPAGNFLWCKSYIRPSGMVQDCIVENDSTFIITGFTDSSSVGGQKIFMMNLNGTGEIQWCRGYSSIFHWNTGYPERMVKTLDNNYALISTSGGRPVLMKINTSGDTLWTRAAKTPGYDYETADLLAYSDGGYLFSGIVLGNLPDMNSGLPYIFKTDSLGHLPCSEIEPPAITISELFSTDSSFTLTSVDGAMAYPAAVTDTTYAPVVTYDGCLLTAIAKPMQQHKATVRPNPNTGHFTVEFSDPLTADSFYSVNDSVGKLLFQRPLAKGTESEEIDLSRFGKGTYLVRITSKDGVCNERVVVQ